MQASTKGQNADNESKHDLTSAISHGQEVLNDPDASAQDIAKADEVLKKVISAIDGDAKSELGELIHQAENFKASDHFPAIDKSAQDELTKALEHAKAVYGDPNASQEEINKAKDNLQAALDNANQQAKAKLAQAIKKAEDVVNSPAYGQASDKEKQDLTEALRRAHDVYNNPNVSQQEIDNATSSLERATSQISGQSQIDKSNLKKALNTARDLAKQQLTDDLRKTLEDAIKHGEEVLNDPNASQNDVDEATKQLQKIITKITGQSGAEITIDPTHPIEKGQKIPGTDINAPAGLGYKDLNRIITREINYTLPADSTKTETQTGKFTRTASYNPVSGKIKYSTWNPASQITLPAFKPNVKGYEAIGIAPAVVATPASGNMVLSDTIFSFVPTKSSKNTSTQKAEATNGKTQKSNHKSNNNGNDAIKKLEELADKLSHDNEQTTLNYGSHKEADNTNLNRQDGYENVTADKRAKRLSAEIMQDLVAKATNYNAHTKNTGKQNADTATQIPANSSEKTIANNAASRQAKADTNTQAKANADAKVDVQAKANAGTNAQVKTKANANTQAKANADANVQNTTSTQNALDAGTQTTADTPSTSNAHALTNSDNNANDKLSNADQANAKIQNAASKRQNGQTFNAAASTQLPQTGDKSEVIASLLGLAGLVSGLAIKRKHN